MHFAHSILFALCNENRFQCFDFNLKHIKLRLEDETTTTKASFPFVLPFCSSIYSRRRWMMHIDAIYLQRKSKMAGNEIWLKGVLWCACPLSGVNHEYRIIYFFGFCVVTSTYIALHYITALYFTVSDRKGTLTEFVKASDRHLYSEWNKCDNSFFSFSDFWGFPVEIEIHCFCFY